MNDAELIATATLANPDSVSALDMQSAMETAIKMDILGFHTLVEQKEWEQS